MGSSVPAADATLRLLSHLAAQRGPVAAASLATALGLPRSSVYQLLGVLRERGFVVHVPETRRWALGLSAFELSSGFSRQAPVSRLGAPVVADLVDRVGESGHLAVLHGRDVLYTVEERARRRPHLITDVGVRLPAHLTASGRALLAALPRQQLRALFPGAEAFVDRTGRGPRSYAELRRELDAVTARGWAREDGEVTPGLASVAVAVVDPAGWPVAAIALTYPSGTSAETELASQVREAASRLAARFGAHTAG